MATCRAGDKSINACAQSKLEQFAVIHDTVGLSFHSGIESDLAVGAEAMPFEALSPLFRPGQIAAISTSRLNGTSLYSLIAADPASGSHLVTTYPVQVLQSIFVNSPELGQSGETFLANNQGLFITQPRYPSQQGIVTPISAKPMLHCLHHESGETLDLDYRNIPIIHGFRFVPELGGGCIMAHIDQAEAFAPLRQLTIGLAIAISFVAFFAWLIAALMGRTLTKPIYALADMAQALSKGDFTQQSPATRVTEIAVLSKRLTSMAGQLDNALRQLKTSEHELETKVLERTAELQERHRRYYSVIQTIGDGFWRLDGEGCLLEVNPAYARLSGFSETELIGMHISDLEAQESPEDTADHIRKVIQQGSDTFETRHRRKDGNVWDVEVNTSFNKDDGGYFVAFFRDITERKVSEEKIKSLAFYDTLTSLANRRLLMDHLEHAIAIYARTGYHCALLFLDLDNFKLLNDTRGHGMGDDLLIEVAHRLKANVREIDTVARLGGDEFIVLLEELNTDCDSAAVQATMVAEKIVSALVKPYSLNQVLHNCSSSMGIVLIKDPTMTADTMLAQADTAMYAAKKSGKNTYRFFDPAMQQELEQRTKIESALRQAINTEQFKLFYQPQVDDQGQIMGVEALIRWQHPELGLLPPARFIPLAEETDIILIIGRWVLETACAQLKAWRKQPSTRSLSIAVNVSAKQFYQPGFVVEVHEIMAQYAIEPAQLKLELTESMVLQEKNAAIAKMLELKSLGVILSMDDFGTGYSSLSYLKNLPFDQIKIDKSFVDDIKENSNNAFIMRSVFTLGQLMGINVIAEGVENIEQHELLKGLGCRAFQGYLFGKPVSVEELESQLQRHFEAKET